MRAPRGPKDARTHGAEGCRRGVREPGLEFRRRGLPERRLALNLGGFIRCAVRERGSGAIPRAGAGPGHGALAAPEPPDGCKHPGGGTARGAGGLPVPLGLRSALLQTPPTKQVTKPALVPALGPAWQRPPRAAATAPAARAGSGQGWRLLYSSSSLQNSSGSQRDGERKRARARWWIYGEPEGAAGGPRCHPDPAAPRGAPQCGSAPGVRSISGGSRAEPAVLGREMSRGEQTDKPQILR